MFVRKKRNRSGSISVVVVNKERGKFVEIKNFGTVPSEMEADSLCVQARQWIETYGGQQLIDFDDRRGREREETERVVQILLPMVICQWYLVILQWLKNINL